MPFWQCQDCPFVTKLKQQKQLPRAIVNVSQKIAIFCSHWIRGRGRGGSSAVWNFSDMVKLSVLQINSWVALSFLVVVRRLLRIRDISTSWCYKPYKPYIFWKLLVQGYQNWYYQVSHTQIHKYTNTNTQIQHMTKYQKDPTSHFWKEDCSRISFESRTVVQGPVNLLTSTFVFPLFASCGIFTFLQGPNII